jgi:hypothetical protein
MGKAKADEWPWTPIEVDCDACGKANPLHEQPPELLEEGVAWECNFCGAKNRMGGSDPVEPALTVLECGHCHATFDPNVVPVAKGAWVCPACSTRNRDVSVGEHATSVEAAQ